MVSLFNKYAVSRSDSISRQSSMGTMTAVGSPLSLETIWISVFTIFLVYYREKRGPRPFVRFGREPVAVDILLGIDGLI